LQLKHLEYFTTGAIGKKLQLDPNYIAVLWLRPTQHKKNFFGKYSNFLQKNVAIFSTGFAYSLLCAGMYIYNSEKGTVSH
jgi:hypothetical protein